MIRSISVLELLWRLGNGRRSPNIRAQAGGTGHGTEEQASGGTLLEREEIDAFLAAAARVPALARCAAG